MNKITVYRDGLTCYIKSSWSSDTDIVIRVFHYANESAWLVPRESDIRQCSEYTLLHISTDDYPASILEGYSAISGNHGSIFLRRLWTVGHGFSQKQVGAALRDTEGNLWRLMHVPGVDELLVHPENRRTDGKPDFPQHVGEILFREDGSFIKILKEQVVQMYPLNRITRFEYLLDGKEPLPDREIQECSFLDHIFIHDVIAPGSVVKWLADHPGKPLYPSFKDEWNMVQMDKSPELEEYSKFPALMTVDNHYRYQPWGAQTLERTITYRAKGLSVRQLEQMYGWCGEIVPKDKNGKYFPDAVEEMYIPKLKKLKMPGRNPEDPVREYDFSRISPLPEKMDCSYYLTAQDCLNPEDPPDRFIRLTGRGKRQYGIALGYSLHDGCTAKGQKSVPRPRFYHFFSSKKMYPLAYEMNNIPAGTRIRSVSYKQYFNPASDPDTPIFYMHKENESWVLYWDFFQPVPQKNVKLPDELTGMKIAILEKTPSVIPLFTDRVESDGIRFQVNGDYGRLVLKLDS